jgi:hypothetical protein
LYDYYSAQGRRIDAGTEIMIQKWNAEVYAAYKHQRSMHILYRRNLTNLTEQQAKQRMIEREERLRTNPTDEDIVIGEALNALLVDLSDPALGSASWRNARVNLPDGISIRSLFFRFAPRFGDTGSGTLTTNLIALGRLDMSRGWPLFLPEDKLGTERKAYDSAYRRLLAQCQKSELSINDVTALDQTLTALRAKVFTDLPVERGFRMTAARYVGDMQEATKIFDASTIDFAQEMIRDSYDYKPQTVGELLAFLRKYRLFFASAAGRPQDGDVYRTLFELLRAQKEALHMGGRPANHVDHTVVDAFRPGSVWISFQNNKATKGTFTVLERKGENFKAMFEVNENNIREVKGTIKDNKIHWNAKDTRPLKGGQGADNHGTIKGEEIAMTFSVQGQHRGDFVLKLKKK